MAKRQFDRKRVTPYSAGTGVPRFSQRAFDARPDRLDFRDLPFRPPLRSLPASWPTAKLLRQVVPTYVRAGLILDQGTEGACTGFGLACVVNYLLWERHIEEDRRRQFSAVSPRMLYELARQYDEWPGERYDGSSCRGALKGWHKHGVCSEKLWPYPFDAKGNAIFVLPRAGWERDSLGRTLGVYYRIDRSSVVDIQAAIANIGAVYVSARVHAGWDDLLRTRRSPVPRRHKDIPDIPQPKRPGPLGGHAFAFVGYDDCGFIVQNSWGEVWGARGFGRMLYADWIAHGTDAWACALGVPADRTGVRIANARWRVPEGRGVVVLERVAASARNPPEDPWPVDHDFQFRDYEPITTAAAYERALVTGNDGELSVRDLTAGGPTGVAKHVREIVVDRPFAWFKKHSSGPAKLAIYAHGGLNDEDGSISRARVLAPYFLANGIYPLFLVWRTGFGETIKSLVSDWFRRTPGADEARVGGPLEWLEEQKDRALEVVARQLGRGIWSEMRENAQCGTRPGRGLDLLASSLAALSGKVGKSDGGLQVHLIGHSAGAILLGHLLEVVTAKGIDDDIGPLASCTLLAPACSVRFANQRYGAAAASGLMPLQNLSINVLSDRNEKRDGLPEPGKPIYGKSLLYLVSRALDDDRKMPILGLDRALDPKFINDDDQWAEEHLRELSEWQSAWFSSAGRSRTMVLSDETVPNTRAGGRTRATHGSFDNNIPVLSATLERIRGSALVSPMEWLDY